MLACTYNTAQRARSYPFAILVVETGGRRWIDVQVTVLLPSKSNISVILRIWRVPSPRVDFTSSSSSLCAVILVRDAYRLLHHCEEICTALRTSAIVHHTDAS